MEFGITEGVFLFLLATVGGFIWNLHRQINLQDKEMAVMTERISANTKNDEARDSGIREISKDIKALNEHISRLENKIDKLWDREEQRNK